MSAAAPEPIQDDIALPFAVEGMPVRGRILRLGATADRAIAHHRVPEPVTRLLGEAVGLAALLGGALKFDGLVTIQTQGSGPVRRIVADYATPGIVRGTATAGELGDDVSSATLLGRGSFALTIDPQGDMNRYQGVVELAPTLRESALHYFERSEQIPSAIRLAVGQVYAPGAARPTWRIGAIMIQRVAAEGGHGLAVMDDDDWRRLTLLVDTVADDELLDPMLAPERLAFRLFHEDGVRAFATQKLHFGCRCSRERIGGVLGSYSIEELEGLDDEDGRIVATCEFCGTDYVFTVDELAAASSP